MIPQKSTVSPHRGSTGTQKNPRSPKQPGACEVPTYKAGQWITLLHTLLRFLPLPLPHLPQQPHLRAHQHGES